ncbi:phage tail protein [Gordonia sp. PKS22-38]|uniref:Phage tail protein n=1 Tax=Gordonia prachuapensis TaxID=3115651 RepID=A0ABU7MSF8_9ACTN|nr:phage tail protein [Gordonia sp. PKS22-38]
MSTVRGDLPTVVSPHPVGATLPSIYADDTYAQGLCESFDRMLGPAILVLDCFPAYLDPATAPADSLNWLAGWIGLVLEGHESPAKKRELIGVGAELLRWRGTRRGVHDAVVAAFGVAPQISEPGGVTVSAEAPDHGPDATDDRDQMLAVTLTVADPESVDLSRLEAVVAQVKPVHLPHQVQVVTG